MRERKKKKEWDRENDSINWCIYIYFIDFCFSLYTNSHARTLTHVPPKKTHRHVHMRRVTNKLLFMLWYFGFYHLSTRFSLQCNTIWVCGIIWTTSKIQQIIVLGMQTERKNLVHSMKRMWRNGDTFSQTMYDSLAYAKPSHYIYKI